MMTTEDYNAFCSSLTATTYVVQWRGAHVWKVGGKVFAIGTWSTGKHSGITFKVSDLSYEILRELPGLRPAPYLASRGMKWVQNYDEPGLTDDELKQYLEQAHHIVSSGLSKKKQKQLGLNQD